jgi:hypothetical protein
MDFEGYGWADEDGKDVLRHLLSLFASYLLSLILIKAGWCGLSPAYLMYHNLISEKREVRTFEPPRYSSSLP